jgi:hypothetical protein
MSSVATVANNNTRTQQKTLQSIAARWHNYGINTVQRRSNVVSLMNQHLSMTPIAGRLMLSCPVLLTLSVTSTEYNKAQQGAHRDSIQNQPMHHCHTIIL